MALDNVCTPLALSQVKAALTKLRLIAPKRPTVHCLANAFFERGKVWATDLDMTLTLNIPELTPNAPFNADLSKLEKVIAGGDKGELVTFVTTRIEDDRNPSKVEVTSGDLSVTLDGEFTPPTNSEANMPALGYLDMTESELREVLVPLAHSMSSEETRYYLRGVFLTDHEGKPGIRMVSTDGHRLTRADILGQGAIDFPQADHCAHKGVIIPYAAITALLKLLDPKSPELVTIKVRKMRVIFETPNWTLETKVVDGSFVSYERVIPEWSSMHSFGVNVKDAAKVVKRLNGLADSKGAGIQMHSQGGIAKLNSGPDAKMKLDFLGVREEALTVTANGKYWADILGAYGDFAEELTISAKDAGDPMVIRPDNQPLIADVISVMMPMRKQN